MDYVYWPASVRTYGYRDHVKSAAAGNFTHLAIDPITYRQARANGLSNRDMVAIAADSGITLSDLDTVTDWAPTRLPREINASLRERFDVSADECFAIAAELGLTRMLAVAGYDKGDHALPVLADGFGRLCDRAKAAGLWVDLEFMPFWGLPNLEDALAVVQAAGRDNCGILVDTWHFSRGKLDLDLLRAVPPQYIVSSQVNDATLAIRGTSLFDDTVRFREFPGEGELHVVEILSILLEKGLQNVGPEVFSDVADTMTPVEVGQRCAKTLRAVLEAAGGSVPDGVLL